MPFATDCSFQLFPASVVATITLPEVPSPRAQQSVVVGQDRPSSQVIPDGRTCAVQLSPPSVVATTAPVPDIDEPAAQQ
jgi:hypothetical protein